MLHFKRGNRERSNIYNLFWTLTVESDGSVTLAQGVGADAGVHPNIRGLEVSDLELHPGAEVARLLFHHCVLVTEDNKLLRIINQSWCDSVTQFLSESIILLR